MPATEADDDIWDEQVRAAIDPKRSLASIMVADPAKPVPLLVRIPEVAGRTLCDDAEQGDPISESRATYPANKP